MVEGAVVSVAGTLLVVGSSAIGVLAGPAAFRSGAAGVVCILGLALYLLIVRAGRVLVVGVVVVGVALAVFIPRVTAEITLTERGYRQDVFVTAVQSERSTQGRTDRRCTFSWADGEPVPVAIRRGCQAHTTVGERVAVLFDPRGVLAPRAAGRFRTGRFIGTGPLALVLPVLCLLAVARSYCLPSETGSRTVLRRVRCG